MIGSPDKREGFSFGCVAKAFGRQCLEQKGVDRVPNTRCALEVRRGRMPRRLERPEVAVLVSDRKLRPTGPFKNLTWVVRCSDIDPITQPFEVISSDRPDIVRRPLEFPWWH